MVEPAVPGRDSVAFLERDSGAEPLSDWGRGGGEEESESERDKASCDEHDARVDAYRVGVEVDGAKTVVMG